MGQGRWDKGGPQGLLSNPIHGFAFMAQSPPKPSASKYHHFGDEVSTYEFGEDANIHCLVGEMSNL